MSVCESVCASEKFVCVCVRERERGREIDVCVCVCVCMKERESRHSEFITQAQKIFF